MKKIFIALLEIVFIYLFIFFIDIITQSNIFQTFSFNIYWIPLLFYSIRGGLVSFLASISSYIIVVILSSFLQKSGFSAGFLIGSAITMGLATLFRLMFEVRRHKIEELKLDLEEKEEDIKKLEANIEDLKALIESLKKRLIYEGEGLSALFSRLRDLPLDDPEVLLYEFLRVISEFFEIDKMSIYKYKNGFFRFVAGKGLPILGFTFREEDSVVVRRALEIGYAKITDVILESEIQKLEPWLVALIGPKEDPYGVLIVEEIAPEKLSSTYEKYLWSLGGWLHGVMKRFDRFAKAEKERHLVGYKLFDFEYYEEIKEDFRKSFEEFGIPFSEICVCVYKDLLGEFLDNFREDDVATKINETSDKVCISVLLAACDSGGKIAILERLKKKYGEKIGFCQHN